MVPQIQESKQVPAARAGYRWKDVTFTKWHGAEFSKCGLSGIHRAQSVLLLFAFTTNDLHKRSDGVSLTRIMWSVPEKLMRNEYIP